MFCMLARDILAESGEKSITDLGDRVQQTRPVLVARQFDGRPRATWELHDSTCIDFFV